MNKLVLAAVVMLFSTTTMAEPSGSLKAMLETKITLIEYLSLRVELDSIRREMRGENALWFDDDLKFFESIVTTEVFFNFDENKLIYYFNPLTEPTFKSVREAKSYCRALLELVGKTEAVVSLLYKASPNGWTRGPLNSEDFLKVLYENTILQAAVKSKELEDSDDDLICNASLGKDGEISSWSFNL